MIPELHNCSRQPRWLIQFADIACCLLALITDATWFHTALLLRLRLLRLTKYLGESPVGCRKQANIKIACLADSHAAAMRPCYRPPVRAPGIHEIPACSLDSALPFTYPGCRPDLSTWPSAAKWQPPPQPISASQVTCRPNAMTLTHLTTVK